MSRYHLPVIHSSLCSTATALTNLRYGGPLGKILTTRVVTLYVPLSVSPGRVVRMSLWWLSLESPGML